MSMRQANYRVVVTETQLTPAQVLSGNPADWGTWYECDAISINPAGELFICDDDDKVIADYPRMGWVDVTITRNYDS